MEGHLNWFTTYALFVKYTTRTLNRIDCLMLQGIRWCDLNPLAQGGQRMLLKIFTPFQDLKNS